PQWRGPDGNGVTTQTELPIAWSEHFGVEWKCELPEWGTSTPAVWDDAIFLTSHVDEKDLVLLKINKKTGEIEWTRKVGTGSALRGRPFVNRGRQKFHEDHNLASPSPVTDGKLVVAHFGNGDLAAYDFRGKQLWHRNLQDDHGEYTVWWGHANSPVFYKDLVISVCMQDSCRDIRQECAPSYVVAHNKQTGNQVWKTMRMTDAIRMSGDSYTTPIFREADGRTEMIVIGGQMLDAYDPTNGRQLWYLPGLVGTEVIRTPVAAHGMIYATQGMRRAVLAVKPGGNGKRTQDDIIWSCGQGLYNSPSPVVAGELLFMVNNYGILRCFDAHTGRLKWKERIKGEYRASPLVADGRVYFLNMEGLTTVVSASPRFDRLTENQLDDETIASPAVSDGKIFIRGRKSLYCLRK
ncbi:MAG: PQQ-binding-like beta-propeller repeat protein, partial [Candidatus Nealsonbacteria bacterium]|nr:PQQ-binding-like beta-propeller repeat protein [Candidatus Nealsonbacteria bacterium]